MAHALIPVPNKLQLSGSESLNNRGKIMSSPRVEKISQKNNDLPHFLACIR